MLQTQIQTFFFGFFGGGAQHATKNRKNAKFSLRIFSIFGCGAQHAAKNRQKMLSFRFACFSIFGGGAQHAAKNQKNAKFSLSIFFDFWWRCAARRQKSKKMLSFRFVSSKQSWPNENYRCGPKRPQILAECKLSIWQWPICSWDLRLAPRQNFRSSIFFDFWRRAAHCRQKSKKMRNEKDFLINVWGYVVQELCLELRIIRTFASKVLNID